MTDALWYLGRGTGTVAMILLSVVVVLGIGGRSGRAVFGLPRFAVTIVHRNAALLSVVFLAIHVVTLLFDPYAQLNLASLVIPFTTAYRPLWMGLGIVASDLVIAIVVTSLLRHRLGVRAWQAVHWLAYLSWPLAMAHSIGAGTDEHQAWLLIIVAACGLAVAAAGVWRLSGRFLEYVRLERAR